MKKLFLFVSAVALTVMLNSCSSDSGSGVGGTITMKINGISKTFNTVVVYENTFGEETELTVTGTETDATGSVSFLLRKGDVGANVIYDFEYYDGLLYYDYSGFSTSVTTNSAGNKLAGAFSGTLLGYYDNGGTMGTMSVALTNGTFSVQY